MNPTPPAPPALPTPTARPHRPALRLACLALAAAPVAALAQDLGIKAPPQSAPVAIINAAIHPVSSPDIERGYIVFDNGRITAIGAGDYTLAGPGTVIDATGRHVYPSLISPVTQLGLAEIATVRASRDFAEVGTISPEVRANVAVNPDSTLLPVTRANGVLVAGVFPASGSAIPGRASVIRLDGWTWEDMTVLDEAALVVNWPSMRSISAPWMNQSEDEQNQARDRALAALADAFRTAAAYHARLAADPGIPRDLRWDAMRAFLPDPAEPGVPRTDQRPVFIFAQDLDQISAAVAFAVEHALKPVIVGGRDAPLAADLLRKHDVPVVILGVHTLPRRADAPYDSPFRLPADLDALAVRWCLASAEETPHERNLPYHAATAAAFGLPRDRALRAITLSTAEILGIDSSLGSLEPGKAATLFISSGDPLEITSRVERAFIDGREIDLSTKQTELDAKYREKYRQRGALRPR